MNLLGYIVYFIVVWMIIFLVMRIWTILKIKRKGTYKEYAVPIKYVEKRYKLKIGETYARELAKYLDLINSLAVVLPIYIYIFIDMKMNTILTFAVMLAIFILIIVGGYTLLGYILKRKEN